MQGEWFAIRVELVSGSAQHFEPPPGRDFLVSPQHTFRQLAEAIDRGFARWDLAHLFAFRMSNGDEIGIPDLDDPVRDAARTKIGRRDLGEVFTYEFDFGDGWTHRCTVIETEVPPPEDEEGIRPEGPVTVWGWGTIPDQYGRTTPDGEDEDDDGV